MLFRGNTGLCFTSDALFCLVVPVVVALMQTFLVLLSYRHRLKPLTQTHTAIEHFKSMAIKHPQRGRLNSASLASIILLLDYTYEYFDIFI